MQSFFVFEIPYDDGHKFFLHIDVALRHKQTFEAF